MGFFDKAMKVMLELGEGVAKDQLRKMKRDSSYTKEEIQEREDLNKRFSQAKRETDRLTRQKDRLEKRIKRVEEDAELSAEEKEREISNIKLEMESLNEELKRNRQTAIEEFKSMNNNSSNDEDDIF